MSTISLHPKRVLKLLLALSIIFMILNVCRLPWQHFFGDRLQNVWLRFNLDIETSIPTWFSSMVLLAASVGLAFVAAEKRRLKDRFARHWAGLAVIFMLLSVDEIAGFHEVLSYRMKMMHLAGPLFYAWVIPGGFLVIVFLITYLRFLFHLPKKFCILFIVSGAVYVFGSLVMETVGGQLHEAYGEGSILYMLSVTAEEGCEMLGASLFVYAQLLYLQAMGAQCVLQLVGDPAPAAEQGDNSGQECGRTAAASSPLNPRLLERGGA